MKVKSKISIIAIGIFFGGAGIFEYTMFFGPQVVLQTNQDKEHCRHGNVLAGVIRPSRLTVISTCEKVVGIVHDMTGIKADDGDYEFNLDLEQPYKKLLNKQDIDQWQGMLHVEIIPLDQNSSLVQIPKNGDRIEIYGAWIADRAWFGMPFLAGWNEIHPVWNIRVLGK